jgi:HEAT repeat protein
LSREAFEVDRLAADGNVAGLVAALGGDQRANAALALGRSGEPRAIPSLIELATCDPERSVRFCAVYALGQLQAKEAENAIEGALSDAESQVRMAAATALGRIRAQTAVPALRQVVAFDSDYYVRLRALESLVVLGDKPTREGLRATLEEMPRGVRRDPRWKNLKRAADAGDPLAHGFTSYVAPYE